MRKRYHTALTVKKEDGDSDSKRRRKFRQTKFYANRLPLAGNPRCKLARLRYCTVIVVDAPVGSTTNYNFLANDLYDPDATGAGHQPLGFDQLMAYYDHFTVLGSMISVRVTPSAGSALTPGLMGIALSDNGAAVSSASSVSHLLEGRQTGRNVRWIGDRDRMSSDTITKKFSHKHFFCKPSHGSEFKGSASGSPSEKAYYEVFVASINGNDPSAMALTVTIDYIALFSEPKELSQS